MLALFGVTTILHTGQAVHHRTWFLLPTAVLCGIMDLLGWGGRLWSYYDVLNSTPFQIQITCAILAPTPLLAATFVMFGQIINRLGSIYSRLTPKQYTILFCTCDVVSLIVQGVGGGLAASADVEAGESPDLGGRIMLGGIAFQLAVITVFNICVAEFMWRYITNRPLRPATYSEPGLKHTDARGIITLKLRYMLGALAISTVVLFARAIYRTIELADGWNGKIISNETYFIVLDAVMVLIAMYVLNLIHPGPFLYHDADSAVLSVPSQEKINRRSPWARREQAATTEA
ncbi:RTA1 like protein-domain-containing protein [Ephemerocybe angulata]|uniref:RTA1 like protein-domain-containing protein n=1 Tax=Ephemerocybe angulata TaxID=980116 RepID=A0A8H6HKT0_9AGAR|nr:RTA1 like protein-domain-containing protein [Tulosesus angulatus]